MKRELGFTTALLVCSALWAAPSFAQQAGGASQGSGGDSRAAPAEEIDLSKTKPIAPPKVDADIASRAAPMTDEKAVVESFTVLSRSRSGKITRTAPDDAMKKAITDMMSAPAGAKKADGKQSMKGDPALTEGDEASRQVFGDDDRVQIKNTKTYPFTAIGFIAIKSKEGEGSCSGTLIGPQTVLTAAHCLYDNEAKDFQQDIYFVPGANGMDNLPYGAYQYDTLNIVEGFAKNYKGVYGEVLPWDLGIITLKEPIGNDLGWLGYANYESLGDFDANIVGFPGDKPTATMWRSTCPVSAENIGEDYFQYKCDTYPGSSGSSVYAYDESSKSRVVVGVNVAESPDANTAVRLNATYVAWVNSLWK